MDADIEMRSTDDLVADAVLELHGPTRYGSALCCDCCVTVDNEAARFPCRTTKRVLEILSQPVDAVFPGLTSR